MTLWGLLLCFPDFAYSAEHFVYSVYKGVELGNPGENDPKDYYVNMGSAQGLQEGAVLEVIRRTPTYDLTNQKLYKDITFPIAHLKVIHVENAAAVARLDKMLPEDQTPVISPRAVMVGDLVRINGTE